MAIRFDVNFEKLSRAQYHDLDYRVMRIVYDVHNEFGRFYDEKIYQNEIAYRCTLAGFESVMTEVPMQVCHGKFGKSYCVDLVINNAVIYELKTVERIVPDHRAQLLNYLLLAGTFHGTLINMRTQSVEHEFITTGLTREKRRAVAIDEHRWRDVDEESIWLRQLLIALLKDWGAFLEIDLYRDAICFFLGGKESVIRRTDVLEDSRVIGTQKVHMLNRETAFKITALTRDIPYCKQHLARFVKHTRLKAMQWINFNHHEISFTTIHNSTSNRLAT